MQIKTSTYGGTSAVQVKGVEMKKAIHTVCLAAFILAFAGACSIPPSSDPAAQSAEPFPIIDIHMHTYQWNKYGNPPQPNLITGNVPEARTDAEAIDAYLAEMDRYNIVLAVGSGELEMVQAMQSQAGDRFLGGVEFPRYTAPENQRLEYWPDTEGLRQLYESGQLQIMGEVTAQYAGVAPNDPRLEPYYALAEDLGIPFCLHTGFGPPMSPYMGDPDFRMRHGNPLLLEDVLVKHPKLRIYIAHGGYPYIEETIALMMMYQQVYVDVSAINWLLTPEEFHAYLKQLMDARLGKRIMFGTDQMIWSEAVGMSIEAIESASFLTEEQKQDIFFNNAADFLKLDKSKYLPGATEYYDESGARVIEVVTTEIRMRPAEPGDQETVSVNLSLDGTTSTAIQVTGFDIDDVSETDMLINGQDVPLPAEIVADVAPRTVTIELEDDVLVEGENTITFVFANAYEGTTGFSIVDVRILLRE
jgi:predicted TIM-barrel fold metal-dependent hydrolase